MQFKQLGHQSDITSKASLFMGSQLKEWVAREAQQEATDATELQGTSQSLPLVVANSSLSQSSNHYHPISVIAAVKKFWRRQVIATIPENECQDHFGTETQFFSYVLIFIHPSYAISLRSGRPAPIILNAFPRVLVHNGSPVPCMKVCARSLHIKQAISLDVTRGCLSDMRPLSLGTHISWISQDFAGILNARGHHCSIS